MRAFTLGLATVLLAAAPLSAQRKVSEQFAALPDGHVRVQLQAGALRITGWDRDSIAVRGAVHETGGERFFVHRDKTGVKLGMWDPTAEKLPPSQLEVFVPARSQLWVKTATATVVVSGVTGGVDIGSSTGAVEVGGAPRELIAETMSGSVTTDIKSRLARIRTATGIVTLRGAITDANVVTVSGPIIVETSVERGRFESVDGDILYRADIARLASLEFSNHAGAVELALSQATAAEVVVNTFEGNIDSALGVPSRRTAFKGQGAQETFTLNGGGAYISVRSFKGPVTLRRR